MVQYSYCLLRRWSIGFLKPDWRLCCGELLWKAVRANRNSLHWLGGQSIVCMAFSTGVVVFLPTWHSQIALPRVYFKRCLSCWKPFQVPCKTMAESGSREWWIIHQIRSCLWVNNYTEVTALHPYHSEWIHIYIGRDEIPSRDCKDCCI